MLVSVDDYREGILAGLEPLDPITLPLADSHGCVLAEDVVIGLDFGVESISTTYRTVNRVAWLATRFERDSLSIRIRCEKSNL